MCRASALLLLALLGAADPGFDAITSRVGKQSHDESCAQMEAWVDAHPTDPNAGRGLIWMAELRLADRRTDLAYALFDRAARDYGDGEWGLHGQKGRADLDVAAHRFAPALETYAKLAARPEPYWQYVGRISVDSARGERLRFYVYAALLLALGAWTAFRLGRARKQLWPPPEELTWSAPVLLLMLAAAIAQPPEEARAVVWVALGGAALLWANGAYLRARPPGRRWPLEALLGLAQAAALLYCAVIANDLWMKFAETLTNGAER
jgi:hypothetical protein